MDPVSHIVFSKPPVIETLLAIQFEPIPGFTNGHLGAFWSHLGGQAAWPHAVDATAHQPEFERFGDDRQWAPLDQLRLGFQPVPLSRLQLSNAARDRMIQIQNGRFIYNWLGTSGAEYARYDKIRPEFDALVTQFEQFLKQAGTPPIQINQWEITYVNHVPQGTVWHTVADWRRIFTFDVVPPPSFGDCKLESFGAQWVHEILPQRGRLRIQAHHAWAEPNGKELIIFSLAARGPVRQGDHGAQAYQEGITLGHDAIQCAFKSLTSNEAKAFWEEQS